jgi:hypothetical protein
LISIRWNYFVVSSSKPDGRPTEAAAAADASKLYVRAVMRLGQRTVCSCDDGRKYFRPASITCFKTINVKKLTSLNIVLRTM